MTLPTYRTDVWKPATQDDMVRAMVLLAPLPARAAQNVETDKASYFVALDGVTRYGLQEAVKSILRGALVHTFFPTPVEIRRQCDLAMLPHQREAERIRIREEQSSLNRSMRQADEQRTPEAQARVSAAYQRFLSGRAEPELKAEEAERVAIRQKYGMTHEVIAAIPDRKSTFKRVGEGL